MRQAEILYREGKLGAAIQRLEGHLRDDPRSEKARGFLFELLLFVGEFDRAERQLSALAGDTKESQYGVEFYKAALRAERERRAYFQESFSAAADEASKAELTGHIDGESFCGIRDVDPRLGEFLEFLAAGAYYRTPFCNLQWLEFDPPHRVRDLFWLPARAQMLASMQSSELDSILVPVLYPDSHLIDDDFTRLGRATEWVQDDSGVEFPCGQRLFVVSGEEVPMLSVRRIEFDCRSESARGK